MTLTGIIIAKNEAEIIESALKSISFCDEIIVIDNNSTDETPEIARRLGALVFVKKSNNFSVLRNFGKEHASGKYILYVDADEIVSDELRKSIKFEVKSNSSDAAYVVKRKNFYLGRNEWPYVEEILRLFKKEKLTEWSGEIHESPRIDGFVGHLDGFLLHFTHRNLNQMLNKTIEWSDAESKLRLESNHPKMSWWRFPRVMITAFLGSYVREKGFKLGTAGFVEGMYQSFSSFITYAKLWEMQQKKSN